jgi:WD40 repeat protein
MPEARMKREASEPENPITSTGDQQISAAFVMSTFEQICLAMSASGAVVAVRDPEGIRCVASTGEAPAVGSRLQSDSAFTRQCIEAGEVVLCEDTENDSRIQPSIAKSLHFRSAVAVPIQAQGSVVGVIEVFSSQPSAIYPTGVAALRRIANLFAPIVAPEFVPGAPPVVGGSTPTLAQAAPFSPAEEQPGHQPFVTVSSPEGPVDSPRPTTEQESASVVDTDGEVSRVIELLETLGRSGAARSSFRRLAEKITPARPWLLAATFLLLLFLVLFIESRPWGLKTSPDTAVPPASYGARSDEPGVAPVEAGARDRLEAQGPKDSDGSARTEVPFSAESQPASKPDPEREKIGAAGSPNFRAVPVEQGEVITSNLSPRPRSLRAAVPRDLKPPGVAGNDKRVGSPPSSALVAKTAGLEPLELPMEPGKAGILAVIPATAPPIKSASSPDFVLDRTFKGHSDWVTGVAFSSYGRLASGSWDQTVKLWDVLSGQELRGLSGKVKEVQALALSRDGRWLAAENSSNTVTLWDATTGKEIRTLPSDKPLGAVGTSWVYSIAFSPDSRWLASAVDDKTVRIWDMSTGRAARDLTGFRRSVIYVAFSPDGRFLASGNDDKSIRIWEVSSGEEIRTLNGHKKLIYAVAFSPAGRWLASASADKTVKLWDVATGRDVRTLTGHGNAVTSLAFSPDGRWLASGSWDKTIKIWDVATGHELQTLGAQDHSIYTVAFDSRGRWLASGSEDGTINLWRLSDAVNRNGLQ